MVLVAAARKIWDWMVRPTEQGQPESRSVSGRQLILLIHGLSGSAEGTWGLMLRSLRSDPDLASYSIDCYAYPSTFVRLPFTKRIVGVRDIARGLRTHINVNFPEASDVILVGHSLGGVVARQYLAEEVKAGRGTKIKGVVLFASPITGVSIAEVGRRLSWRNRHLRQLGKESDLLEGMSDDWVSLDLERKVSTLYVVGGADKVVPPASACPRLGANNVAMLVEYGHTDIIRPTDKNDIRYKALKSFILNSDTGDQSKVAVPTKKSEVTFGVADVLFDVYTPASEPFYSVRRIDELLKASTRTNHVWMSGDSGTGKTAALRHLGMKNGFRLFHLTLGSYQGLDAIALTREICSELYERSGQPFNHARADNLPNILTQFRAILRQISSTGPVAIIVEEIPLIPGPELEEFVSNAWHVVAAHDAENPNSRVLWLFCSLSEPSLDQRFYHLKFRERVEFLHLSPWCDEEIRKLVEIIRADLQLTILPQDLKLILKKARGSPRFIKMLFRSVRGGGSKIPMSELLNSVSRDLFGHDQ